MTFLGLGSARYKELAAAAGVVGLFYLLMLTVLFMTNYYAPGSAALQQGLNPFHLLIRWDAIHYFTLATAGYEGGAVFFPLYPMLIRLASTALPLIFSAYLVSYLSLTFALWYFWRLLRAEGKEELIPAATALLLLCPFGFFFALPYTEALFLCLVIAFFYYLRQRAWLIAALIGAAATATRNVGIFLLPVYFIVFYEMAQTAGDGWWRQLKAVFFRAQKPWRQKEFWYGCLIPLGLLLYCLFCYYRFDDFLAFVHQQSGWSEQRSFLPPWQWAGRMLSLFTHQLWRTNHYDFFNVGVIQLGSWLAVVATGIYWLKKQRWGYAAFCLLNALLFACMFPMVSVNRYVIVLFPIALAVAELCRRRLWLLLALLPFSLALWTFYLHVYSTGGWVG